MATIDSRLSKVNQVNGKTERELEDSLSAFAHRFPVSGHIVHAVSQEQGGVLNLVGLLERKGLWNNVEQWIVTGKPTAMTRESVRTLFSDELLQKMATSFGMPQESVEAQLALGIPKFFTGLGNETEEDFTINYGLSTKKSKSSRGASRAQSRGNGSPP